MTKTNFMPIKEALRLVILKFFQYPSSKITAFLMRYRKNFGMIKTSFMPIKEVG